VLGIVIVLLQPQFQTSTPLGYVDCRGQRQPRGVSGVLEYIITELSVSRRGLSRRGVGGTRLYDELSAESTSYSRCNGMFDELHQHTSFPETIELKLVVYLDSRFFGGRTKF